MKVIQLPSGSKFYQTPCGLFPSVTTILKATMPEEQRERLRNWQERQGSQAGTLRTEAAERGKIIHKLIESRLRGENLECPLDLGDFWQEAKRILGAIGKVTAIETPVHHPRLQYAGTLDLLAHWQDIPTIFDFKTNHQEKRSKWLTDAKLQIAAYQGAYEFLFNVEIPQGAIVVITPHTVQLFTLERAELEAYWQEWLLRLEQYRSLDFHAQLFSQLG